MTELQLTERQYKLFEFVKQKHGDQKRKYTGEPYYHHLLEVANIVATNLVLQEDSVFIEIALGHDLYEDTNCTINELNQFLIGIGYSPHTAYRIACGVNDLTDRYTSKEYPSINRTSRKNMEVSRLQNIPAESQTVKYADLISNTSSIVARDPGFAKTYLEEKRLILTFLDKGDKSLYFLAIHALVEGLKQLRG